MNEAEYKTLPGVRWTHLRAMSVSPAHYQEAVAGHAEETRSMRLGRAIDCAVLEPDVYDERWVTFPGERRGNAWKLFQELHSAKEILNANESAFVVQCTAAVRRSSLAMAFLSGSAQEVISWVDETTGLRCKARPDVMRDTTLTDLKTASDATPGAKNFGAAAARLGYHGQIAFYYDGMHANGYQLVQPPVLVVVETHAPWDVVCYEVPEHVLQAGRSLYQRLLLKVLEAEAKYGPAAQPDGKQRRWPGRSPERVVQLEIPDWAIEQAAGPLDFGDGVDVSW